MNTDHHIENILKIIQDIEKKTIKLKEEGQFHKIDKDILMERVRNLYEKIQDIDNESYTKSENKKDAESEITQEDSKEAIKNEDPLTPKNQPEENQTPPQNQVHLENKTSEYNDEIETKTSEIKQEKPGKQAMSKEKAKEKEEGPGIVAEKFQNTKTFRHDNLAKNQPQNDLSSKMQAKPIHDLTKAIGVNDKFLFIKELFDGNREKYHEAIQILNEIPSWEEAEKYIKSFSWDEEKPEVKKFLDLIRRKFL